jgi:hypothetical protein
MNKLKPGDKVEYIDGSKKGVVKHVSAHAVAIDFGGKRCCYVDPVYCMAYLRKSKKSYIKPVFNKNASRFILMPTISAWWTIESDISVINFRIAWIIFDLGFTFLRY